MKICICLLNAVLATGATATLATGWTNPNANLPSFSSTYLTGERILLSWQPLNQSRSDLWLTRWDTQVDTFALRLQTSVDISIPASFAWQIAVSDDEVLKDTRFELSFIPSGEIYNANDTSEYLTSPAFNIQMVNQGTTPNGTVGAVLPSSTMTSMPSTAAASTSSATATATATVPIDHNSPATSLSTGSIVGISIAVIVFVGVAGIALGYVWFKKKAQRQTKSQLSSVDIDIPGPYEVLGDSSRPAEMDIKGAQAHEMMVSKETMVSEAGSSVIHEVGNTVKRPGLHEMPG